MGYIGRGQPDRVLTSADIGEGAVTLADISFTDQPSNVNITGDYPKQTMRLCDNATVTGDVTIGDGLILAKLASDGDSVTLTSDGTNRTISGSGLIEANTIAQSPNQSLTGMTGELGSAVTFPDGHVLQTLSGVKTDSFTTTAGYNDGSGGATITGLSVSITPASTSNKILVTTHLNGAHGLNVNRVMATLYRGTTKIAVGGSVGSRQQVTGGFAGSHATIIHNPITVTYLDSPSSTSALTYTWKIGTHGSGTAYVNRSEQDSDEAIAGRTMSAIVVQEIKG